MARFTFSWLVTSRHTCYVNADTWEEAKAKWEAQDDESVSVSDEEYSDDDASTLVIEDEAGVVVFAGSDVADGE